MTDRTTVTTLHIGDDADAWSTLGFAAADDEIAIGSTRLHFHGTTGVRGLMAWDLADTNGDHADLADTNGDDADLADTNGDHAPDRRRRSVDGFPTSRAAGPTAGAIRAPHPNGITIIDHVVMRSPDVDRSVAALSAAGFDDRGGLTSDRHEPPLRQHFLLGRDWVVEVIGPVTTGGDAPMTAFGLAFVSPDLDATARVMGDALGPITKAIQPGRRIATVRTSTVGVSVPTVVMSPRVGTSNR